MRPRRPPRAVSRPRPARDLTPPALALAFTLALATPAAAQFPSGEAGQLELANRTANRAHPEGSPLPSDPDGVWDCDNVAFMKYRVLRDVLDWPVERLALAVARRGSETHMIVIVRGAGDWAVLDHATEVIAPARQREGEGWRIEPLPYEPAASPSAPWVMQVRSSLADYRPSIRVAD